MAKIELRLQPVGPWPMNSYVLVCQQTGESVLIDPGAEPEKLTAALGGSSPVAILLTHTHPDHIGALDAMRQHLQVPLLAFGGPQGGSQGGPHFGQITLDTDRELADGDTVAVGNHTLRVYHTPGHIADQICFAIEDDNRIIVGDTLFEGGPGKTWSAEQFKITLDTLRNVVLEWPDDTICYPGHGSSFRLGDKREAIEGFVEKDHGDFYGDATWEM